MFAYSRWQTAAILGVTAFFCLAALPNVLPAATLAQLPSWAQRTVPLGYELRGGERMVLELDADDARQMWANIFRSDLASELRRDGIAHAGLFARNGVVELRLRELAQVPLVLARLAATQRLDQPLGDLGRAPANTFPDATGRPFVTARRDVPPPPPMLDVASDGAMIRIALSERADAELIDFRRRRALNYIRWYMKAVGFPADVRASGPDRIVVDAPGFDRARLIQF